MCRRWQREANRETTWKALYAAEYDPSVIVDKDKGWRANFLARALIDATADEKLARRAASPQARLADVKFYSTNARFLIKRLLSRTSTSVPSRHRLDLKSHPMWVCQDAILAPGWEALPRHTRPMDAVATLVSRAIDVGVDPPSISRGLDAVAASVRDALRGQGMSATPIGRVVKENDLEGLRSAVVERLRVLNKVIFEDLKFGPPGPQQYYEIENNVITQVLKRRTGQPIAMTLVYLAVAERVGVLGLRGLNTPGHFVCGWFSSAERDCATYGLDHKGPARGEPCLYVDAFDRGAIHESIRGVRALQRAPIRDDSLAPAPPLSIALRMLNNLYYSYRSQWESRGRQNLQDLFGRGDSACRDEIRSMLTSYVYNITMVISQRHRLMKTLGLHPSRAAEIRDEQTVQAVRDNFENTIAQHEAFERRMWNWAASQ